MRGLGAIVSRATPAPYVGGPVSGVFGHSQIGVPVTAGTTNTDGTLPRSGEAGLLALSAAWRCLHILTDGIGALELYAYDDEAKDMRIEAPSVLRDPWPVMTPVEWRAMVVASLCTRGNAYLLPYDEDPRTGYPRQLAIVHPDRMHVELSNGRPIYFIDEDRISALDVLHIRGFTPPGAVMGIGIVEAMRRGIQMGTQIDTYQYGNLTNASVPPAIIHVNRPEISRDQAEDIQTRWVQRHGYGSRTPAVMPNSMNVETIAWSPEDTQFLESKQFMSVEICWWFGIDPRVLGLSASGQSLTYSNVESTYVDLQRMSFMPWTSRIESALTRVMPRNLAARFDFSPMLRTTLQDRYSAYATAIQGGWLSPEEVRQIENLGPPDSESHLVPHGGVTGMRKQVNESLPAAEDQEVSL